MIAHVAQETPAGRDAGDRIRARRRPRAARDRARRWRRPRPTRIPHASGEHLAELHHRFDEIDGYSARARAATLLAGLGFADAATATPVASFSGGWRMRLNLAQALMCRSDLLLLDEPTNHLDLDAVLWLEDWLGRYPGTLLLITHDRDFLDAVGHRDRATSTARKLQLYTGNYAQFERERAQALAPAAGGLRQAAAADRAPARVHRPLPRQGDQGEAGAKPDQGARAHGADRGGARRQPVRVRVSATATRSARSCVQLRAT